VNAKSGNLATEPDRFARKTRSQLGGLSVVAAGLIALLLSGCGMGSSSSQSGGPPQVCKLLPQSKVAAVTGKAIVRATGARLDTFPAPTGATCDYSTRDGLDITAEVLPHLNAFYRKNGYYAASNSIIGGQTPLAPVVRLAGVGDKAIASALGIAVLAGSVIVEITGVPQDASGNHAQVIHLAQLLISALGQ
jgi:hypothetical protein